MGLKESATWDWDNSTWGGRGKCIGTVLVSASMGVMGFSGKVGYELLGFWVVA
nr:hypothetical protein [Tanacetum cinerariifolium]